MNKKIFIIVAIIVLIAGVAGAYYLGTRNSETVVVTTSDKSEVKSEPKAESKKINMASVMQALQAEVPTVTQFYEYTEQRDPNNNLGKEGYYVAGANFYDTRTNNEPAEDAFGTDAGGAIEVYSKETVAKERAEYLKNFQGSGMLDSGAFEQVGVYVLRASSDYTKSQQGEVLGVLKRQVQ